MNCKRNKSQRRKHINNKTMKGGKRRVEKIYINLGRQHTNPDIRGDIRIKSGPTTYDADSRMAFLSNFFEHAAKSFEEDLAVMSMGEPKSAEKQKVYKVVFYDNDEPLEEGSENPIKCKKKKHGKKSNKTKKSSKKQGGGDGIIDVIGAGLNVAATKEVLEWRWYWMLLEQRLALNYNDYEWLEKNRNLSISDYNPELFSMERIIKDFCNECKNNPEYMKKVSKKLFKKYPNFCEKSLNEQKKILKNLRKTQKKK